ncbi:MAG: low molecular weight phosphotyrosine protein phosphatase [Hahellaceae bacterium]|nr:low molecular weight phosphotyrosine protein phosphatase [Hahellaceae bacterium]
MARILFVCLGNICRSPTAEGVFRQKVAQAGLTSRIEVDSAGTSAWHIGSAPDPRSCEAAQRRGYDLSSLRARQVSPPEDFEQFDLILAMDRENLVNLQRICPADQLSKVKLFLDFASAGVREVPDPYYGGAQGFDQVLDLVEAASDGVLAYLLEQTPKG